MLPPELTALQNEIEVVRAGDIHAERKELAIGYPLRPPVRIARCLEHPDVRRLERPIVVRGDQIDDGLGREAWNRGTAHVLEGHRREAGLADHARQTRRLAIE